MTRGEISIIERFIRLAKSHSIVTMNPDTIGAVVQMIYEIWQAKDTGRGGEIMYILDTSDNTIHKYGTNPHDSLVKTMNGKYLYYENLQNGETSRGDYRFCDEYGVIPGESETLLRYGADDYFNIGGFWGIIEELHSLREEIKGKDAKEITEILNQRIENLKNERGNHGTIKDMDDR